MRVLLLGAIAEIPAGVAWTRAEDLSSAQTLLAENAFDCAVAAPGSWNWLGAEPGLPVFYLDGPRGTQRLPSTTWGSAEALPWLQSRIRRWATRQRTARHQAAQQQERQEENRSTRPSFARKLENLRGLLTLNSEGSVIAANQDACDLLERGWVELHEKRFLDLVATRQQSSVRELMTSWRHDRGSESQLTTMLLPMGEVRPLLLGFGDLLHTSQGSVLQLELRAEAEQPHSGPTARAVKAALHSVLGPLDTGILLVDHRSGVLAANAKAGVLLAIDPDALINRLLTYALPELNLTSPDLQSFWVRRGVPRLLHARVSPVRSGGRLLLLVQLSDRTEYRNNQQHGHDIQERERRRMGQDLHDGLGQELAGLAFLSEVLARRLKTDVLSTRELAGNVVAQAKQAVDKVRSLARNLYPANLERHGLTATLLEVVNQVREVYGLSCDAQLESVNVSRERSLHLLRIAQEAINNAVRHGRPQHLQVRLYSEEGSVVHLVVSDDGIGLPGQGVEGSGLGLHSMRQHAELMDGGLEIQRLEPSGTQIHCWAPLGEEGAA